MAQYDICSLRGQRESIVVILQHDVSSDLHTCVVAPLVLRKQLPAMARMRPLVLHQDQQHVVVVDRIATVPRRDLSRVTGSAAEHQYEIKAALDFLFSGF